MPAEGRVPSKWMHGNRASTAARPRRFVTSFRAVSGAGVTVLAAARSGSGTRTHPRTLGGPRSPDLTGDS